MSAFSSTENIQTLGKYALIEKVGEGNLGSVFRGLDQDLGHAVAIRILCDGIKWDDTVEELFHRECRTISGLKHPHIAALMDVGIQGQSHYIVMESLGTRNLLDQIVQKSILSFEAKLSMMIQVAEGLSFAHKNGVLHLDLTPGKIHLTADGSIKIRDFTIAHILMKHLPHPIIRWGDPIYLSPEQIRHESCDVRTDVFSTGTIFYELFTGLHPFHDPNGNVALDNILLDVQIPTFDRFPDVPPQVWGVLKTCLARNPEDRYQHMDDLVAACRELAASVREDTQLMLGELYAAVTPLRSAAAQPNASGDVIRFLEEIQKLSRGEKESDYVTLDRLMTALIDLSPSIRSTAESPDPFDMQIPLMESTPAGEDQNTQPDEAKGDGVQGDEALPDEVSWDETPLDEALLNETALDAERTDSTFLSVPVTEINTESQPLLTDVPPIISTAHTTMNDTIAYPQQEGLKEVTSRNEPHRFCVSPSVAQNVETATAEEMNDRELPLLNPAEVSNGTDIELPKAKKTPAAIRYRQKPRPSYRAAVILLSILVIVTAGYIVYTKEPAPLRDAWSTLLAHSSSAIKNLVQ